MQQAAARWPWFHDVAVIERVKDLEARRSYVAACAEHGWSRNVLALQIDARLHERQGRAPSNLAATLPPPQSDLAQQIATDPYVFEFLSLSADARERDLERGLLAHLRDFLLELGVGFAFVGTQVHLEVAGEDFSLDLLFYHLRLRCFVVVELKVGPFQPEYAGKLNFYLSAVDAQSKHPADQPTIGILLCKGKKDLVVEYALRDLAEPIGVASWETRLVERLPDELAGSLPTVEEMEAELGPAADERDDPS